MSSGENPYGDGHGSERIVEAISRWHQKKKPLLAPDKEFQLPPRPAPRRRKTDLSEEAVKLRPQGRNNGLTCPAAETADLIYFSTSS